MIPSRFDVLAIGNAIVDVVARADEAFLLRYGMRKGAMALIDETRAAEIYDAMGPAVQVSGGSAANTTVGLASFGASAAFIGKIRDDPLGHAFAHDIRAAGVFFETAPALEGPGTGRCYILVTPDGERTLNTFLGAARHLGPEAVDVGQVAESAIIYLEGYLWDPSRAKEAFLKAAAVAHEAGRLVALSLSDAFCVDRWRKEFVGLIRDGIVDVVLANQAEAKSLYQTADLATALDCLRRDAALAVVTLGSDGCVVLSQDALRPLPALPIERLVDTTGAGDLFAAGFLFGMARGFGEVAAARLGALAAGEVIQHLGARPEISLKALADQNGLLA